MHVHKHHECLATDIIIRINRKSSLASNGKNEFCITKNLALVRCLLLQSYGQIAHAPHASELLHLMCCPFSAIVIVVVRLVLRRRLLLAALAPTTTRRLAVAFSCFATMVLI